MCAFASMDREGTHRPLFRFHRCRRVFSRARPPTGRPPALSAVPPPSLALVYRREREGPNRFRTLSPSLPHDKHSCHARRSSHAPRSHPPALTHTPHTQYCTEVKTLFKTLSVPATIVELDALADGDAVAAGVQEVTGRRTVPQVFIGGAHVGGCDGASSMREESPGGRSLVLPLFAHNSYTLSLTSPSHTLFLTINDARIQTRLPPTRAAS